MHRLLLVGILTTMLVVYYFFKQYQVEQQQIEAAKQEQKAKELAKKKEEERLKKVQAQTQIKKPRPYKITKKKQDYLDAILPALNEVYSDLQRQHKEIKALMEVDPNSEIITNLKRKYKVQSNEEVLIALKPHPKSIAIAQGAMESAWGTSRFYKEAYNIFGVWSLRKNEKRIAAGSQRGSTTIWLRKYDSVKESIADYYLTMARSKAFRAFKKLNYEVENQNPYLLVTKLDKYSEKGAVYGQELASMIRYNRFTNYDAKHYAKPKTKPVEKVVTKEVQDLDKTEEKPMEVASKEKVDLEAVTDVLADNEDSFADILKKIPQED